MRSRWIARAGKAGGVRRQCCSGIGVPVVTGEQRLTTRLARDTHEGGEIIRGRARDAAVCHTAIAVAEENASKFVDGDFVEVEQVAILVATALLPDAAGMLNRVIRRSVDSDPVLAAIVSGGDEDIPVARKAYCLVITGNIRAGETDCGAAGRLGARRSRAQPWRSRGRAPAAAGRPNPRQKTSPALRPPLRCRV